MLSPFVFMGNLQMQLKGTDKTARIMIVAGEASGDLHGSNLIRAACDRYPELAFFGVGGDKMVAAGCRLLFSADELAVMGIWEVVTQLPRIWKRFQALKKIILGGNPPDVLVLIDFPDFNLRLAKVAKAAGIRVLYYITPKVWAWRKKRAKVIAENTDKLAVIFPFEPEIFKKYGADVEYVGNPLLDEFAKNPPKEDLRQRLGLSADDQIVGIFPGSRKSEIKYILDTLLETAKAIYRDKPGCKFMLPVAPSLNEDVFRSRLKDSGLPFYLLGENIYEVAKACDAVLCVSGTVTLQVTLVETPMAILYKVAPLSFAIGKCLIKIKYVGLTNIVAGRGVVKEFLQDDAEPESLCHEIIRLLDDKGYARNMRNDLNQIKQILGAPGSSQKVADMVYDLVNRQMS